MCWLECGFDPLGWSSFSELSRISTVIFLAFIFAFYPFTCGVILRKPQRWNFGCHCFVRDKSCSAVNKIRKEYFMYSLLFFMHFHPKYKLCVKPLMCPHLHLSQLQSSLCCCGSLFTFSKPWNICKFLPFWLCSPWDNLTKLDDKTN